MCVNVRRRLQPIILSNVARKLQLINIFCFFNLCIRYLDGLLKEHTPKKKKAK